MKHRYFILPFIIISLIIYVIDNDKKVINKEIIVYNYDINYPFFNNKKIDNYIFSYLNNIIDGGEGNVTYELDKDNNLYYLTFYSYADNNNMISTSSDSFVININKSKIDKWYK